MEVIRVKKGELIAKRREKVKEWYIIQEGTAMLKYDFVESKLGPNTIIGILEQDWYICDYIASTDVTLFVFPYAGVAELKKFLAAEPKMRRIFLRTSLLQRHQLLCIYSDYLTRIRHFQHFIDTTFNDYTLLCAKNKVEIVSTFDIEKLQPLEMRHRVENWEISNSNSLVKSFLEEYLNLHEKDENLCIGAIMEASAQMHRVAGGVGEMVAYLNYNRDVLLSEKTGDLFHALFELEIQMKKAGKDYAQVATMISNLFALATKLGIYDASLIEKSKEIYETSTAEITETGEVADVDDLTYILNYAGYEGEEKNKFYKNVKAYRACIEANDKAKEEEAYQLRKLLNKEYYELYEKCFFVAAQNGFKVPPVMEMFFNFGYLDSEYLGEEKTNALYELSSHLELCQSNHVFTIYEWIKAVYNGEKDPSKNEFDMDYQAYLVDQYKSGEIQKSDIEVHFNDRHERAVFEMQNMFKVVNRLTYGNIMSFCPILSDQDLFNNIDKMLVTTTRVDEALDQIRKIDFSAYYRPLNNHGLRAEMTNESLMCEILPDVILMPNAGTKAMMWQETASIRNDTPARFMIPIFTASDVNEMMIELTGRYRWEICRKIQGVHWNDARDHSLTSEYYDYLQFYRKNRDLSAEIREQIKGSLVRAKNNFREVFVRDYQNWIKYEAKGGFRLNKYVRKIVFGYCPFSKSVRDELKSNPMFAESITKYEGSAKQTAKRLEGLYEKYKQNGGEITPEMKENLHYYQM